MSLYENINKKKKAGTSRSKKNSTISAGAYKNIGIALNKAVFTKPNSDLQKIILSLLNLKKYVSPRDISKSTITLLKFEPSIKELFKKHSAVELNQSLERLISNLSEVPLLFKFMSVCPFADLELEVVLT